MRISDFQIHDRKQLDAILVRLCELVIDGQRRDPDAYMMCASAVLDTDNNCVAALNYWTDSGDVHAERAAIDAYHARFGEIPEGSIILTTCSPCTEPMPDRVGESCKDLISSTPVHKVYAGYRDPSQQTSGGDKTYHLEITRNKKIQALCQAFADTWLQNELNEGAAEHVRMVMTSAADLMKQHGFRAVGQLSEKDLEQIAQQAGVTLHDVCIILNIDHVDEKLDESGLTPPNLEIKKYPGWNMYPGSFRVLAFLTPNTNPVGTLVVYPNANGQWIGEHMVVSEKYQRLGIGTAMWNFAEKTVGGPVTTVNLTADGKKFQKARAKTKQELDELSFLGSPCTKDCSGHRAGYAWSQSKGGRVAQSPFSPSFNNGSQLYVDGK